MSFETAKNGEDIFKAFINDSFFSPSYLSPENELTALRANFLKSTISQYTPDELVAINSMYEAKYGKSLRDAIKDDNKFSRQTKDELTKELDQKLSKSKLACER